VCLNGKRGVDERFKRHRAGDVKTIRIVPR
jgi:hypothetical protein